jgi:hypothetical protein
MATSANFKIALAVQGSYGHVFYATGMLDAFRAYNHRAVKNNQSTLCAQVGSGCVEMLTPLYFLLAHQCGEESLSHPLKQEFAKLPLAAQQSLFPAGIRSDAWQNYFRGLAASQWQFSEEWINLLAGKFELPLLTEALSTIFNGEQSIQRRGKGISANLTRATEDLLMYYSGLPGMLAFNPFFIAATQGNLGKRYDSYSGPTIFSNATNAVDLGERYLYYGDAPSETQQKTICGSKRKRQLLRMTPEYFFASGARPPYIAPMPVKVGHDIEFWMEGAMRCNPPLTPLIDMGATHIILLRFFSQDRRALLNNTLQLNERSMDVMFSIPLQKELESIHLNNHLAACQSQLPTDAELRESVPLRRHIYVLDPSDETNPAYVREYSQFVNNDLNALSHYAAINTAMQDEMFERGAEIGQIVVKHLLHLLEDTLSACPYEAKAEPATKYVGVN